MCLIFENVFKRFIHDISMKNLIMLTVLTFFLFSSGLSLVEAQQEPIRFYHEIGTNLTIYEKCRVDGAICDATYTCSLTVIDPDQNFVVDTVTMLGTSTYRNFTLNQTQTIPNGIYESTVDCTNTTFSASNTFFYQITPDGSAPVDTAQGIILFVGMAFLVLIILFLAFLGIKANNPTVSLGFLSFAVLLMVFGIGFSLNVLELSFGTFGELVNNYSTIYVLFIALIIAGSIGLILYLIWVALNYYWSLRGMKDTFSINT